MSYCLTCGKETDNKKYCSRICHYKIGKKHVKKICIGCKKEFNAGQHNNDYCSRKCYLEICKSKRTFICIKCGKTFIKKPSSKIHGNEKYCSIKCFSKSRINKIEIICPVCDKKFYRIPANIKKVNCCSNSCANVIKMKNKKKISKKQAYVTKLFETALDEKAETEVIFDGLKDKGYLFVDAIFNKNNIALEYNGPHHYKEISYTRDNLVDFIRRDSIKKEFLINNNFIFIEWPHTIKITKEKIQEVLSLIRSQADLTYIKVGDEGSTTRESKETEISTSARHPL